MSQGDSFCSRLGVVFESLPMPLVADLYDLFIQVFVDMESRNRSFCLDKYYEDTSNALNCRLKSEMEKSCL